MTVPAEQKIIREMHAHAMRVGTCTDPADRPTTERIITEFYKRISRPAPKFWWFDGPMAAIKAIAAKDKRYTKALPSCFYGGENMYWIATHLAGRKLGSNLNPADSGLLDLWHELSAASGWWFPFENGVVCAERPRIIKMDQGVIHSADGPAIECRDGFQVFAWRGTRIPGAWYDASFRPELAKLALTHENLEQRRCAAEMVGWATVLANLNCKTIDSDPDPEIGRLVEVTLPDADGPERFLIVRCATGREFALGVAIDAKTARAANASTYRMAADEYQPEFRT
jgi:hypothetical protein